MAVRGEPLLPEGFARAMLKIPKPATLEDWFLHLETTATHPQAGRQLAEELHRSPQTIYNRLNLIRRALFECVEAAVERRKTKA